VQEPLSKQAGGTAPLRLPGGWIERARTRLCQAHAWVAVRLAPRPQAPTAAENGEPEPGASSEETGASQLESGG